MGDGCEQMGGEGGGVTYCSVLTLPTQVINMPCPPCPTHCWGWSHLEEGVLLVILVYLFLLCVHGIFSRNVFISFCVQHLHVFFFTEMQIYELCIYLFQILYNRTIVQLGMCAFRHGKIKDAHDVLMDLHSPPRPKDAKELAKELLAQVKNNLVWFIALHDTFDI